MDLQSLQKELTTSLNRAENYRRIIRVVKSPIYIVLFLWMLFVLSSPITLPYLIKSGMISLDVNFQGMIVEYLIGTGVVIMVLSFFFSHAQRVFARIEHETIARIIHELFPLAKMHDTAQEIPNNLLKNSMLFNNMDHTNEVAASVFASFELLSEKHLLHVTDMGIVHQRAGVSAMTGMYMELFRQIFKSRVEMAAYQFRGMFAWAELEKRIPGCIVIMPDHLENKLGYMAKHVQMLKNKNDIKLTLLEDVEFERLFAVYASDEVLARYILTPAMMANITELRLKYGRDMMISFNANRFYIAVTMPNGFLNLRGKAIKNNSIVEEIYNDINTTQSTLTQIKLDKTTS